MVLAFRALVLVVGLVTVPVNSLRAWVTVLLWRASPVVVVTGQLKGLAKVRAVRLRLVVVRVSMGLVRVVFADWFWLNDQQQQRLSCHLALGPRRHVLQETFCMVGTKGMLDQMQSAHAIRLVRDAPHLVQGAVHANAHGGPLVWRFPLKRCWSALPVHA